MLKSYNTKVYISIFKLVLTICLAEFFPYSLYHRKYLDNVNF